MFLTREEERILSGEEGEAYAKAMEAVVKVGEIFGAEKLIPVKHAHVSGISYFNIGDAGREFIGELAASGVRFSVYTTANPYAVIEEVNGRKYPEKVLRSQNEIINSLRAMGAKVFTCAPYFIRPPDRGEHLAWAESNAVLFTNSVLGAWTNREGGPLALFEAIAGRTYYAGVHRREGRIPRYLISVFRPSNFFEASALGYLTGKLSPDSIPYVKGLAGVPNPMVRLFLAAFGSTSGAPMVVLEGITPKYESYFKEASFEDRFSIGKEELRKLRRESTATEGKIYMLGCPHLSRDEIGEIASFIRRYCAAPEGRELWLLTSTDINISADVEEFLARKNVKILRGICPIVSRLDMLGVEEVVTDSGKAFFYLPKLARVTPILKDRYVLLKEFCGVRE